MFNGMLKLLFSNDQDTSKIYGLWNFSLIKV